MTDFSIRHCEAYLSEPLRKMIKMIYTDFVYFRHCEPIYRRGNLFIGLEIASASTMPRNDKYIIDIYP